MNGSLSMIAWRGYDDREAAGPFLRDEGLSLEVVYVDADVKAVGHLLAGELGRVDLLAIDNRYLPMLLAEDLLAPIDPARLPHAGDVFETFSRFGREDGVTWSIPYIWGRQPMPYNAAYVEEPPTSWLDVLRPEYRGKVAMLDGFINQLIIWGRVLGYPDPAAISRAELNAAIELAVHVKRDTEARLVEWDEIPALLASGEAWIATAGWEAIARFAAKLGRDVRLSYPREEAYPWMDSWCIPKDAPNEDAAYGWIDWMIRPEPQRAVCCQLLCGTVNREAVPLIDHEMRASFRHERIDELFAPGAYVGNPPLEADGDVATLADWRAAWEEVRAA